MAEQQTDQKNIHISTSGIAPAGIVEISVVYGTSCLSRNFFKDMGATMKNATIGGELKTYAAMMDEGVKLALERMAEKAAEAGATGVYGVQIATPQVSNGAAEIIAFGTAYKFAEEKTAEPRG